jgi:hypothetical protein
MAPTVIKQMSHHFTITEFICLKIKLTVRVEFQELRHYFLPLETNWRIRKTMKEIETAIHWDQTEVERHRKKVH